MTRDLDPTAHAEVVAMRSACQAVGDFNLAGCVLVSSCEPCPLCLAAALWARVDADRLRRRPARRRRGGFDDLAFYDLFDTPRDQWALPVGSRPVTVGDGAVRRVAGQDRPCRLLTGRPDGPRSFPTRHAAAAAPSDRCPAPTRAKPSAIVAGELPELAVLPELPGSRSRCRPGRAYVRAAARPARRPPALRMAADVTSRHRRPPRVVVPQS